MYQAWQVVSVLMVSIGQSLKIANRKDKLSSGNPDFVRMVGTIITTYHK